MNLDKLQNWLISTNNDVAYISDPISINYFTGYSMDPHERIFALLVFLKISQHSFLRLN